MCVCVCTWVCKPQQVHGGQRKVLWSSSFHPLWDVVIKLRSSRLARALTSRAISLGSWCFVQLQLNMLARSASRSPEVCQHASTSPALEFPVCTIAPSFSCLSQADASGGPGRPAAMEQAHYELAILLPQLPGARITGRHHHSWPRVHLLKYHFHVHWLKS